MNNSLGIYIHIPFCIKKCRYCDFCSFPDKDGERVRKYTDELCRRISEAAQGCKDYTVDTVYFGGGTPTLLPIDRFERIIEALGAFRISDEAEITAECNPATADHEYLRRLRTFGVNRLSIGLQSTHENELSALGRVHSFVDFKATYFAARDAGFSNISADLMYGIPYQTEESFEESLKNLAELSPEHISAYGLKIEQGTPFYKMRDKLPLPDEDAECAMYLGMTEILSEYGYEKYEISNFAKKGFESRHNLRYWRGEEYLGFGVAAHSYFRGERFGNSRDIDDFLRGESIECERYAVDEKEQFNEYVMLSLRLCEGIDLGEFQMRAAKSFFEFFPKAKTLISEGYMRENGGRIAFTDKGYLVSNTILSDMIEFDR
ncbi:MAG: radical SAM family heme chaperone HemW [Clostridia bacterium]|nr:radical SAM family heme chaperone HemW [Clostridia bacterium]